MHAVNNAGPILTSILDQKPLLIRLIQFINQKTMLNLPEFSASRQGLLPLNDVTGMDEGSIIYTQGGEGLAYQIDDPDTQLVVTSLPFSQSILWIIDNF